MKTFNKKKGFTIVELVIVIAVIGVLTAVLVPTFVNLVNKANQASDESLIKNLNTQLRMKEQTEGKNPTLTDALLDAKEAGYLVENLTPKGGRDIVWNQDKDEFGFGDEAKGDLNRYWKIYEKAADVPSVQTYSIYAKGTEWAGDLSYTVGFDAGENEGITSISYLNATSSAKKVTVRTNGGTLMINAPLDTVAHYGEGVVLDVRAIAGASYHEYGYFPKALIAQGRIVVEEEGNIPAVEVTAVPTDTNPIQIETDKDIVVFASEEVVEELGGSQLEYVDVKVTDASAEVVVDEAIDASNVEAAGKTEEDLVSITKVKNFTEFSAALTAQKAYVMFTDDISYASNGTGLLNIAYSATVDGNGYALNGYGARGSNKTTLCINNNGGTQMVDVKLQNLTINNGGAAGRPIETRGNLRSLALNSVTVNATGSGNNQALTIGGAQATAAKISIFKSTINASASGYPIISFNPFEAEINDSYFNGYCGIYFKHDTYGAQNCVIVATNTTFNSPNSYSLEGDNSFGVFAIQENVKNNAITLNACKVNAEQTGTAYQALVSFGNGTNHSGTTVTINGSDSHINGLLSMNGQLAPNSKIVLNGGTYTIDPLSSDAEKGTKIVELGQGKTVVPTSDFTWIVK